LIRSTQVVKVFGGTVSSAIGQNAGGTGGSSILADGRRRGNNSDGRLRSGRGRQERGRAMDGSRIGVETVTLATAAGVHSRDRELLDLDRATTVSGTQEAERIRGRLWRAARGETRRASDQNAGRLLGESGDLRTESLRGAIRTSHRGSTDFRPTDPSPSIIPRRKLQKCISRNRTAADILQEGIRGRDRIEDEALL